MMKLAGKTYKQDNGNAGRFTTLNLAKNIDVPLPCVLKVTGVAGVGKNNYLMYIANQALSANVPLIYMDLKADFSIWASLASLSSMTNQTKKCYSNHTDRSPIYLQVGNPTEKRVRIAQVLEEKGVLYTGFSSLEMSATHAMENLQVELDELRMALLTSQAQSQEGAEDFDAKNSQRAVVIFDGVSDLAKGITETLLDMLRQYQSLNVTFVLDHSRLDIRTPELDEMTAARVYFCCEEVDENVYDFEESTKKVTHKALKELTAGEVIIATGKPGQGSHMVIESKTPFQTILIKQDLSPEKIPDNSV